MTKYRYVIHCATMPRSEEIVVENAEELIRAITRYIARYGNIDLLYNVGHA